MAKYRTETEQQAYEGRMRLLNQKLRITLDLSKSPPLGASAGNGYKLDESSLKILNAISEP